MRQVWLDAAAQRNLADTAGQGGVIHCLCCKSSLRHGPTDSFTDEIVIGSAIHEDIGVLAEGLAHSMITSFIIAQK